MAKHKRKQAAGAAPSHQDDAQPGGPGALPDPDNNPDALAALDAVRDHVASGDLPGDDPAPAGTDELPPLGTPEDTDAPPVDAQAVAALTSLEPEEVRPPLDSPGTVVTTDATAAPVANAGTGGSRNRYDTPEKKAERNRKERERLARKNGKTAQAAEKPSQVSQASQVARKAQAASQAPAKAAQGDAHATPGVDLSVMLGLSFHAISLAIPERFGGGSLTPEERDLLGKAWAGPLAPYLSGEAGPWAVAAISTVQVFAVRAMTYQPPAQDSRPAHGHVREPQAQDRPQVVMSEPPADGIASEAPKRTTAQEPGVGGGD